MSEPVILIPGLMCDARVFAHQITHLCCRRPVMVALPTPGNTVEEMSLALLAAAPPRFAVIGLGLGGDVALDLVRRGPERVTRIALISTDPLAETSQVVIARDARMVAVRAGRLLQAIKEEYPQTALAEGPVRATINDLLRDMAETLGEAVFLSQTRAMQRRPDQQKTMRRALLPAMIMAGAQDSLVPLRRQEFVAGLMPFAKLHVIAGAGHFPPLEQPEVVTKALEDFLQGPLMLR